MPRKVKATAAPSVREEISTWRASGETCLAKGDFGYSNLSGVAYLKFNVRCGRIKGHEGKHACLHEVRIAATEEGSGLSVDRKSIEVEGDVPIIRWNNKE